MRKLISFLVRYFTVILFLLLQSLAFLLIFKAQPYQRSAFYSGTAQISGLALSSANNIENYLKLGYINQSLAQQNAALLSAQKTSYFTVYTPDSSKTDTIFRQQYTYIAAEVINSSHTKRNNYITINRGKKHGIQPDMAVISDQGAVGVVKDVSNYFATVIPIIHSKSLLSVDFKSNPYFGTLSWNGKDYRLAQLSDVPREAKFSKGDTIVSSTRSLAFPKGIPVGYVKGFEENPEDLTYQISVKLAQDFAAMHYVYVVKDFLKAERVELENQTTE